MGKLKLIFVSLLSMLAWNGAFAENIETDVTAQFPLDWQGWTGATGFVGWAAPQVETNDGRTTAACEQYNEGTIASTGVVFSRKLTGLANGNYTIELYGAAAFTPGRSCSSTLEEGDETAVHLYAETPAGTVVQPIPAHVATDFNGTGIATAKLEGVQVTDGTVTIGMYKDKGLTNWHVVQIKGVTAVVDKDELLASLFQPLVDALAAGEAIKANVPSESEAIASYDAAVADAVAANANRTLDFDVASAVEVVKAAAKELSKAQTAPGSDLTAFIVNPEANGASDAVTGWTADKPNGGNGPMKPSGDAIEYWAGNANPRAEAQFDIWQEITGLPNGKYTVSADMYNSLNGEGGDYTEFSPTCGVYAAAGEVEVVKLVDVEGDALNTYTTTEIEVTDGTLRIGVKNTETPMAARWFVADNFKLTLVELTEEEPTPATPYDAALAAIEDGKNYSVFTEVDGTKYYLTADGTLADSKNDAGTFTFQKTPGGNYEYGFKLNNDGIYFSNPPSANEASLKCGYINTSKSGRNTWEAQVFFLNEDGLYAVRSTNAPEGGVGSWEWIGSAYWTVDEGPVAEYQWEPNYIWQLEENVFVEVTCNLVEDGEVTATETASMVVGTTPKAPQNFVDKFHGFYPLTPDVEVVAEETTAVNFTREVKYPFDFSENFDNAIWYNMDIRSGWQVSMCESEPYTMKNDPTDEELESPEFQWAFVPVEGQPFQMVVLNRAAGAEQSLSKDGNNVVMRDGAFAWEIFANNDGFVMRPAEGDGIENMWVNQSGGGSAEKPLSFWNSPDGKTDNGSTFRVESTDPYDRALAAIEDGESYRIFTEVDGEKYYVTADGYLDAKENAGQFTFEKVTGNTQYEYGFLLNSQNNTRFSNPVSNGNINDTHLNSTTNNRKDWEAQVFFKLGGKYAIRATNAPYKGETSGWAWVGNTYWTANEGDDGPSAGYSFDKESNYIWQFEGPLSVVNVKYELYDAEGNKLKEETKKQEPNSEVDVPIAWTSEVFYDFETEGEIGDEDCVIKVTRNFKDGIVLSLDDFSNEKAYTIRCNRGALLTKDDHLASTGHNSLTNAEPADFAVISYEDNFYLYSIADGKFLTFEPTISPEGARGPLAEMPTHGTDDALKMNPTTKPYFLTYFTVNGTNYGLNTNGNDPYGYVINTWMNADDGNQYYFIESGDFDPTDALAALDAYFNPSVVVTYVIKDADGNELFTSEPQPARPNDHITSLPDALKRAYTEYSDIDVTITDEETTIDVTATWNGPIVLADEYDNITWQNLYIYRGEDNLWYLNIGEETQFLTQNPSDDDLAKDEFQWGFVGNPYAGLKIYNKATGDAQTLTNGDAIGMADGEFVWDLLAANAEGILIGTDGGYLNQWGGATGTNLGLWGSTTDMGSTFYAEVVEVEPLEEGEYNGVIRQILSHPQTGVQGEATGKQTIAITDGEEEGTVDITFSGFTMPVTGAELPEFTVEGVEKTENEDGTISYELPGWAPNKVVIDRGTGTVTYKVTLTGSQESEDATPVLKLTLENSVVDTVWFAASQSDIDDAIEADEATAIRGINGLEDAGIIFDLSGRKVAKIQRGGIYIVNGKKISVK